jgi:hypothetical protein
MRWARDAKPMLTLVAAPELFEGGKPAPEFATVVARAPRRDRRFSAP